MKFQLFRFLNKPLILRLLTFNLFIFIFTLFTFEGTGQSCIEVECDQMKMTITPVYENVDNDCSITPECGASNPFHQLIYSVDIQITSSGIKPPFYLDYEDLFAGVKFQSSSPFSKINEKATMICNGENMSQWDSAILKMDGPNRINLSLRNNSSEECDGDMVLVDSVTVGGVKRGIAHLFNVVVDVHPCDTVTLLCDAFHYYSKGLVRCNIAPISMSEDPIDCESSEMIIVSPPDEPDGINEDIMVTALGPAVDSVGDVCFFLVARNLNSFASRTITYLEFTALLELDQVMEPPMVLSGDMNHISTKIGTNYEYRFWAALGTPIILAGGARDTIAKIKLTNPLLTNLCWSAILSTPTDSICPDGRLTTVEGGCSGLISSPGAAYYTEMDCDPACTDSIYAFTAIAELDNTNCGINVRVGLISLNPLYTNIILNSFKFGITLETNGTLEVDNIDYGDFVCGGGDTCDLINNDPYLEFDLRYNVQNIDVSSGNYVTIHLTGAGCLAGITINEVSIRRTSSSTCVPLFGSILDTSVCVRSIAGILLTELHEGIENATVNIVPSDTINCPTLSQFSNVDGRFAWCGLCLPEADSTYNITPTMELDPLNGVNTYDLILISRHILGLEPLNSPYKLIAADANKSGTITTFDIIELRKLILGTYTELPNNSSWRFIDSTQVFTNPANPFADVIRGNIETKIPNDTVAFIGAKIGDVDNTAIPNNRPQVLNTLPIAWHSTSNKKSEFLTIPVTYEGDTPLEAIQFSLQFDQNLFELVSPSQGDVPGFTEGSFGLTKANRGIVNTLWFFNPQVNERPLEKGDILFNLTLKTKGNSESSQLNLSTNDSEVPGLAWTADGQIFSIIQQQEESQLRVNNVWQPENAEIFVEVIPNPVNDHVNFRIKSNTTDNVTLGIFGPFGTTVLVKKVQLSKGEQVINIPNMGNLPSGVYNWRLWNAVSKQSGTIVKQ